MNISRQYKYRLLAVATSALLLSACGGGSSDSTEATATTGTLSIAITDAPVDDAEIVNVQFTEIELKPKSGESTTVILDKNIDLYVLQGGASVFLFDGLTVDVKNRFETGDLMELVTPSGDRTFRLANMMSHVDKSIDVAPGSGHVVKIPIPEEAYPQMIDEFALLVRYLPVDAA